MNCHQKSLNDEPFENVTGKRYAYSWYVTSPSYLCAALIAFSQLKEIKNSKGK